jgi:hypothetical protein
MIFVAILKNEHAFLDLMWRQFGMLLMHLWHQSIEAARCQVFSGTLVASKRIQAFESGFVNVFASAEPSSSFARVKVSISMAFD